MKKLTVTITDKNGEEKDISVYVENETAEALEQCSEDIRRMYILDEYEDQKLTHKETRRHISYEQITELGLDIASDEESQEDRLIRLEVNSRLHTAMKRLTDKNAKEDATSEAVNALISAGSFLVVFSDLMLVLNWLVRVGRWAGNACMGTYYPALCLLAFSMYFKAF